MKKPKGAWKCKYCGKEINVDYALSYFAFSWSNKDLDDSWEPKSPDKLLVGCKSCTRIAFKAAKEALKKCSK